MKIKIPGIIMLILMLNTIALGAPNGIYVTGGPADIQFQLIDPLGNKTGYEPSKKDIIENIPNTMYTIQQLTTISDKPWGDPYHRLQPIHNSASYFLTIGKYQLKIYGTNITRQFSFGISIPCYEDNRDLIYPTTKKKYLPKHYLDV
jgi:hypothetical protein